MKVFDKLKKAIGLGRTDEVATIAGEQGWTLPDSRYYRRAIVRGTKLRGPGYTRSLKKGRKLRERQEVDL